MSAPPTDVYFDPLDLRHLDRQVMGDARLADELLELFVAQSMRCLDRIRFGEASEVREVAHMLKGAARAVGAFRVAESAQVLEASADKEDDSRRAVADLAAQIAEATRFVDTLRRRDRLA